MAEADDIVIVDENNCQCGRHPTFDEHRPKSEGPFPPKPAVKPKRFTNRVTESPLPKEESATCKCHNSNIFEALIGPAPPSKNRKLPHNGSGPGLVEKLELHNHNDCNHLPPPVPPIKPCSLPIPPPPPPPPPPPMAAPVSIVPPMPHRFKSNRHRRSDSIDSYDSSSDESAIITRRRRGRGGKRWPKLTPLIELSSHREMTGDFMPASMNSRSYDDLLENGSCSALLHPFNRRVYVNSIKFSATELKKYFWLLKLAEPEIWYPWPSKQTLAQMSALGEAGLSSTIYPGFAPIANQPKALSVPRICLGQSLLDTAVSDIECDCVDEKDDKCWTCDGIRKPSVRKPDMRFYSVQQSEEVLPIYNRLQDPRDVESHTLPIYRVVATGSWDAAAAQAYYDAGANGWSTLFTCVVTENVGEKLGEIKGIDAFERVDRLWKLAGTATGFENANNKIFY